MCIKDFWRNRTETRSADIALYTGECVLKTSGGTGEGLDLQLGLSIEENVH